MSNIILPKDLEVNNRMEYDFEELKSFLKEIINYGYVEKKDETIPLKHDKIKQFGRFRVRMDTKYKVYETDIWED